MTEHLPTKPSGGGIGRRPASFFMPLQREFDRLFDQLGAGWSGLADFDVNPRVDVRDTKGGLEITAEVPGIAQEDLKITIEDNVLTISGEKKSESEKTEGQRRISERAYGSFSRSVVLPSHIDADKVTAAMKDGVLTLTAPRSAEAKAKTIAIKPAS
jgi:HSP20 family protein